MTTRQGEKNPFPNRSIMTFPGCVSPELIKKEQHDLNKLKDPTNV